MRDTFEFKRYIFDALYDLDYADLSATLRMIVDYVYYDIEPTGETPSIAKSIYSLCKKDLDKTKKKVDKAADRKSKDYIEWRQAVFKRDNFTCQSCGKVGGSLNAHHIKPFAGNPEKRFDITNGVTLCKECHKEVHRNAR